MAAKYSSKSSKLYKNKIDEKYEKTRKIKSFKYLIVNEQYSKALYEIENYLQKYKNDSYGLFQLGCVYYAIDEKEEARKTFQYIVDSNMESKHSALYKLAILEREAGNIEEAEKILIENIETSSFPENYSIIELSNIQLLKGDYTGALECLYQYGNMQDDEIIIQEAVVQNAMGNTEMAYESIINHEFSDDEIILSKYYSLKSVFESVMGDFEKSEESILKCYNCGNNRMRDKVHSDYASICYRRGDYDKAIELCFKVLNSSSDEHKEKVANIMGSIYRNIGDYEKGKEYYLKAHEYQIYPSYRCYFYLAELCTLKGDYQEAKKWYLEVVDKSKNKSLVNNAYIRLGYIGIKLSEMSFAEKNYQLVNREMLLDEEITDYAVLKAYMLKYKKFDVKDGYYGYLQLDDYSIDRLVEHIDRQHHGNGKISNFKESIDLEELVLQIQPLLTKENLYQNYTVDTYLIDYDNVGYVNNREANLIEVITYPNTKKIITMYPCKKTRGCITNEKCIQKIKK